MSEYLSDSPSSLQQPDKSEGHTPKKLVEELIRREPQLQAGNTNKTMVTFYCTNFKKTICSHKHIMKEKPNGKKQYDANRLFIRLRKILR